MNQVTVNKSQHTHHSDYAAKQWEARKSQLFAAVHAQSVVDHTKAKSIVDALCGSNEEERRKAIDHLFEAAKSVNDADMGRRNLVLDRHKAVTSTVLPMLGQTVETFVNYADETDLDMQWRQWFATDPLQGGLKGSLYDILNLVSAHDLPTDTSDIPASDFMAATWANILPEYKGARVRVSREILQKDPMTTVNAIIVAIRYALEVKKSQLAYTATQAAITSANSSGYTTAYTGSSVVRTINVGRTALIQRNFNKGYGLSGTTPCILVANEAHRDLIEAAFMITVNSLINSSNGTFIVQYPISRVYTYNLAADLGISGTKCALILPSRKNRFGIFNDPRIESYLKQDNNAMQVDGREAYNWITEDDQFQVLTIA